MSEYIFYTTEGFTQAPNGNNVENCSSRIIFKTKELAQQAIEILGEETVKLALEPLGI